MSPRLTAISRRRAALVARAASQRDEVGRLVDCWHTPLTFADKGIVLVRSLRAHPIALAVGVALLMRVPGGRLGLWVERLWAGWLVFRSLREQSVKQRA